MQFANRKSEIEKMENHKGMRPHDIVILLKIIALDDAPWYMKDLANTLYISAGEVSESLNRSMIAGLISNNKKRVLRSALLEFILYGLKYVFPQRPGSMQRGMVTAHSAFPLSEKINSEEKWVWPFVEGNQRGLAIEPLHPNVPKACLLDENLHELLSLTDAIRAGNSREFQIAADELKKRIL